MKDYISMTARVGPFVKGRSFKKIHPNFVPYYIRPWDKDEVLLISRRNGILKYNPVTDQITPTDYPILAGNLNAVYLDSKKRLYLSSYNKGFVCYAPDGKSFTISIREIPD